MRVLILATDIYTRGGIARYTATLGSALGQLLGLDNVDLLPLLDDPERRFTPADYRILEATAPRLTLTAKSRHLGRALRCARRRYDLVFCSHVSLAPIASLIRRFYGTPYLVVCYGSEAWYQLPLFKRAALQKACLVLADSRFTAEVVSKVNNVPASRIRLLPNAITEELARDLTIEVPDVSAMDRSGSMLLSVGSLNRVHAYKGIDTVIEALPLILRAAPGAHYTVVGEGDHRPALQRLAARVGVGDHVTFTGEVTDAELAGHYRACNVFVLPSRAALHNGRCEGEGFGRVYVEASLAGKPVVGSRDGGAAEAVLDGKTGLLVNPRSAREVADAVISLLQMPERAAAMGAEGRRWALEHFTPQAMRRSIEDILLSLVRSSSVADELSAVPANH